MSHTRDLVTFLLTDIGTGRQVGVAGVCLSARYATIRRPGDGYLIRCRVPAALWPRIDVELADALPTEPLEHTSAIVELLVPERRASTVVQYISRISVEPEPAVTATRRLDALLLRTL